MGSMVLAFIAAIFYFLIAINIIAVPHVSSVNGPPGWAYLSGVCYALGGILISLKKRWLWIVGLVMNTLVMGVFFTIHLRTPEIIFSLPGLGTKIAQVLLEGALIYLVANHPKNIQKVKTTA
jgi:hypothetical protein